MYPSKISKFYNELFQKGKRRLKNKKIKKVQQNLKPKKLKQEKKD